MSDTRVARTARAFCYACFKPGRTCICNLVPRLKNRTRVTLIQHPREQHHPLGTARFAELGLQHVERLVDTERCLRGSTAPVDFPRDCGLLYPSPNAVSIETIATEQRPSHLIVIDGTWHQARTLYRDMTWLHQMPHYGLNPAQPSRYRIRREPKPNFVSTLEALLYALQVLEPELIGGHELLRCFDGMIDEQIRCAQEAATHHGRRRKRTPGHCRKPRALAEDFSRLVIFYVETTSSNQSDRQLVHFAAERLRTGEVFERSVVRRNGLAAPNRALHESCGEDAPDAAAVSVAVFEREWERFVDESDVFAAWSPDALRWLPQSQRQRPGRAVSLKAAYGLFRQGKGSLDDIVTLEQLPSTPPALAGRPGQRLAHAKALAWLLHGC